MNQQTIDAFEVAKTDDLTKLEALINNMADAADRDELGNTLLHIAALYNSEKIAKYLLDSVRLSPYIANYEGVTPWDIADANNCLAIIKLFENYRAFFDETFPVSHDMLYSNPVRRGFFPDPSWVRVGDDYYMVNSTFVFFPCIPISHSRDLIHWEVIGYAITNPDWARLDDKDGGRGYWAPDISYHEGRFYITATLRCNDDQEIKRYQMVTSSGKPEGPYDEPVFLNIDGIDPSIFRDNGRTFMLVNRGARCFELSNDCKTIIKDHGLLWYGAIKVKPEGPHLLKKDGYYYIFMAEGGTGMGHSITVARSKDMFGPYEQCPHNPILHQYDGDAVIQCTGHGKPLQLADGSWAICYLCLRKPKWGYGIIGRETCIDHLTWDENGWPYINKGRGPSDQQTIFIKTEVNNCEKAFNNNMYYDKWQGRIWLTPRALSHERISITDDSLKLTGSVDDLNTRECRSVLLTRQDAFSFVASTTVVNAEITDNQDLGLTCYYDENSYIKFGVGVKNGKKGILVQEYVGDDFKTNEFIEDPSVNNAKSLCFEVTTECLQRSLSYSVDGNEFTNVMTIEDTSYLSSEGLKKGKRFTGATVGVYVHGDFAGEFKDFTYSVMMKTCS